MLTNKVRYRLIEDCLDELKINNNSRGVGFLVSLARLAGLALMGEVCCSLPCEYLCYHQIEQYIPNFFSSNFGIRMAQRDFSKQLLMSTLLIIHGMIMQVP